MDNGNIIDLNMGEEKCKFNMKINCSLKMVALSTEKNQGSSMFYSDFQLQNLPYTYFDY